MPVPFRFVPPFAAVLPTLLYRKGKNRATPREDSLRADRVAACDRASPRSYDGPRRASQARASSSTGSASSTNRCRGNPSVAELIERAAGEAGIDSGARGEVPAGCFNLLLAQRVPTEVDTNDPAVLTEGPDSCHRSCCGGHRSARGSWNVRRSPAWWSPRACRGRSCPRHGRYRRSWEKTTSVTDPTKVRRIMGAKPGARFYSGPDPCSFHSSAGYGVRQR